MLIGDGVEVMFIEGERGRWRRHTIGIGGCLIGDEAVEVQIADFVATTLKQVLRSIKARYYLPGCSHRLVNVLVSVVIGRPLYELPT